MDTTAFVPFAEARERLGYKSDRSIYRALACGDLPGLRIRGRVFILRAPFERMLRGEPVESAETPAA